MADEVGFHISNATKLEYSGDGLVGFVAVSLLHGVGAITLASRLRKLETGETATSKPQQLQQQEHGEDVIARVLK